MIDNIILDIIYILFPVMCYLVYVAYIHNLEKKRNIIALDLMTISMLYFTMKYGIEIVKNSPLLIINASLIIAYIYKTKNIAINIIIIIYYFLYYKINIIILLIGYLIIYLLPKKNSNIFIIIFNIILYLTLCINTSKLELLISIMIFTGIMLLVINLMKTGENIVTLRANIREIEKDKQIKISLFKITHEIKNPIAVCKGYLDMFDINKKDNYKKYIPILKEEINKVLFLLQDFLAMNKVEINKEIIDINLLLEENLESLKPLLEEKKITYKFNLKDDEIYIYGDYNRLSQVIINIIKNSIEAIEEKGHITVTSTTNDQNVIITITDNGIGIEDIKKIKEPFYTTKKNGTGLGVSLSNEIINLHNGNLEYESEKNKYTKVLITIPKEKAL